VLADDTVEKVDAGKILRFAVLRIEHRDGAERYIKWIAPALGCFPLRSQVLVDELVRQRVDTILLNLLPEDTHLALPKGIRIVSPQTFCDLYRKKHGQPYLPDRLCAKYQRFYEKATAHKQ